MSEQTTTTEFLEEVEVKPAPSDMDYNAVWVDGIDTEREATDCPPRSWKRSPLTFAPSRSSNELRSDPRERYRAGLTPGSRRNSLRVRGGLRVQGAVENEIFTDPEKLGSPAGESPTGCLH